MTFGERIKSLRTESKMTMRELAKEVGVSAAYIHHIECQDCSQVWQGMILLPVHRFVQLFSCKDHKERV